MKWYRTSCGELVSEWTPLAGEQYSFSVNRLSCGDYGVRIAQLRSKRVFVLAYESGGSAPVSLFYTEREARSDAEQIASAAAENRTLLEDVYAPGVFVRGTHARLQRLDAARANWTFTPRRSETKTRSTE